MNFKEIAIAVQTAYMATVDSKDPVVPFLWGPPGVGKSACLEHVARTLAGHYGLKGLMELGDHQDNPNDYFGFIDMRLSQVDAVEIAGFPHPNTELGVMERMIGDWFPHVGRADLPDRGIIFLDEWTSAPQLTQAASYQLANDRRLGSKKLKPGWVVAGAGNRIGDGGVVFKQPLPLSNRIAHFNFESDFDGFISWGARSGEIQPWITSFLNFRPDHLNTFEDHVKKKLEGQAFATERTWHRLSRVSEFTDGSSDAIRPWAIAYLGQGVAQELIGFREVWLNLPSIKDVIDNPRTAPLYDKPDVLFALCGALAAKADTDNFNNIMEYVSRIEQESFTVLFLKDAVRRNSALATTPEFTQWAQKFVELLRA